MNNENIDPNVTGKDDFNKKTTSELDRINSAINGETTEGDMDKLEDDIIRNDTIPETSKNTPGSSGAFPVGAFDTSKD